MFVTGYFRLNPWEVSVELGHKYGVPVVACMSESRVKDEAGKIRKSEESYRARAVNAWASGADAICMFNFFNPNSRLWWELGDTETLSKRDKVYTTGARGTWSIKHWMTDGYRFLNSDPLSPERPRVLQPDASVTVDLDVHEPLDDLREAVKKISLRVFFTEKVQANLLSVKLNGRELIDGTGDGDWIEYETSPENLKRGTNEVAVSLSAKSQDQVQLQDLVLYIDY